MHNVKSQNISMPALGYGTWMLSGDECVRGVRAALDIGYTHIDTAQIYENEAEVGSALADSGVAREKLFVTTKVWIDKFKAADVKSSTEESLKKLRMDYVDLLLVHWPNPAVSLVETLGAFEALLKAGKTKAIGISNFPVKLMREAVEEIGAPIACNQVEYHSLLSQKPVLDYAHKHGIIVTAYSPLARGRLEKEQVLIKIGQKHGKTPSQIGLRWLIEQEGVVAIPKAASEKHARANFEIFDFALDAEDRKAIDAINGTNRLIDPDFAPEWDAA